MSQKFKERFSLYFAIFALIVSIASLVSQENFRDYVKDLWTSLGGNKTAETYKYIVPIECREVDSMNFEGEKVVLVGCPVDLHHTANSISSKKQCFPNGKCVLMITEYTENITSVTWPTEGHPVWRHLRLIIKVNPKPPEKQHSTLGYWFYYPVSETE